MRLRFLKTAAQVFGAHSETILTCISIGSTLAAVYFALKDGPKCAKILAEMEETGASTGEKVSAVASTMWRVGLAVAVSTGASLWNRKLSLGKIAGLTESCYILSNLAKEYEEKEAEIVGPEVQKKIRESIAKDRHRDISIQRVVETGHGTQLIQDEWSKCWFRSNTAFLQRIGLQYINRIRNGDEAMTVNEFYQDVGLPTMESGRTSGWHPENFNIRGDEFFLSFDGGYDEDTGESYAIMRFCEIPRPLPHPNSARYYA